MSGLPVEYGYKHDPKGQVSAEDRDALAARLNAAYTAGELTIEDYQARLDALFAATSRGELVPVMDGLPARYRSTAPAGAAAEYTPPGQVEPLRPAPRGLVKAAVGTSALLVVLIVLLVILL